MNFWTQVYGVNTSTQLLPEMLSLNANAGAGSVTPAGGTDTETSTEFGYSAEFNHKSGQRAVFSGHVLAGLGKPDRIHSLRYEWRF